MCVCVCACVLWDRRSTQYVKHPHAPSLRRLTHPHISLKHTLVFWHNFSHVCLFSFPPAWQWRVSKGWDSLIKRLITNRLACRTSEVNPQVSHCSMWRSWPGKTTSITTAKTQQHTLYKVYFYMNWNIITGYINRIMTLGVLLGHTWSVKCLLVQIFCF